ncbi:MAG: DUF370 domain-containing protein [Armatimonadetes bacterium]|nr:DUF370 domain-containing protein [Armatimonadota bacterium]
MFVHVGGDVVVDVREVVAILDVRQLDRAPDARALLKRVAERLEDPAEMHAARAIVVTTRGLVATPTAPATVARRMAHPGKLGEGAKARK